MTSDSAAPVSIEELLAHAEWVQRLASRLVRDAATAEDVVQQTWLAGLRRPPTSRAHVRGWLARVVRNFAREAHRRRTAYEALERDVARPEAERWTTEDLVRRADASRKLAGAVVGLPEPYRTAILRRYYQGLSAREIAGLEGTPVETVRTRVKRAVGLLRDKLRSADGDGWILGLAPLIPHGGGAAAPAATRLSQARRFPRATAAAAAAAVILVGLAWFVARRDAASDASPGATSGATQVAAAPRAPLETAKSAAADAGGRAASATPPVAESSPAAASVSGPARVDVVLEPEEGAVAVPIQVVATPHRVGAKHAVAWAKTFDLTAAGGPIDLPRTSPAGKPLTGWELRVEHPDLARTHCSVDLPAGGAQPAPCTLRLERAGVLLGVVVAPRPPGESAPHVAAFTTGAAPETADERGVDADGRFRLRLLPGRAHRIVVAARDARPVVFDAQVPGGETRSVDRFVLDAGLAVAGSAEDFDGRPAAGAPVEVSCGSDGRACVVGPYLVSVSPAGAEWTIARAPCDEAGRFRVGGLPATTCRVCVLEPSLALDRLDELTREVAPGGDELRFRALGGAVAVRVLNGGVPVAGADVTVAQGPRAKVIRADAAGVARFVGTPGASYQLRVASAAAGMPPRTLVVVAPALESRGFETFDTAESAPPARLTLKFTGPGAAKLDRAGVALLDGDASGAAPAVRRDVLGGAGVFHLDALPAGKRRVVVRPGAAWDDPNAYFAQRALDVDLVAGADSQIEIALESAGRLALGARTADGRFVAARCTLRSADGAVVHLRCPRRDAWTSGEFEDLLSPAGTTDVFPALPPGAYTLRCVMGEASSPEQRIVVRAGETTRHVAELVLR